MAWSINQLPSVPTQAVLILILAATGVPLCTHAVRRLNRKDPGCVVWDEIASLPITFFLIPADLMWSPTVLLAGFALHRVFDITKPPPARQLERLPDGLGVMADDWAAAVYSCLVLHGLLWWLPPGCYGG